MKILVRLPNWLGDVIMSTPFLSALRVAYPESEIDVIVKKELSDLVNACKDIDRIYKFSKKEYPGIRGLYLFGKSIQKEKQYDLFFCLPDSFSSALIGYFTGSKQRIGYRNEFRNLFLTKAYTKERGLHRAEEYMTLLNRFSATKHHVFASSLESKVTNSMILPAGETLVLNINSEAQSRKMPIGLATEIIVQIKKSFHCNIVLTGGNKDVGYVADLEERLKGVASIYNYAGKTSLAELIQLVSQAKYVISVDSGIAHLSNAFLVNTIVLFGAGDEKNTAPYNKTNLRVIRKEGLECAPCLSNTCKLGTPICLTTLDSSLVIKALRELSEGSNNSPK